MKPHPRMSPTFSFSNAVSVLSIDEPNSVFSLRIIARVAGGFLMRRDLACQFKLRSPRRVRR